MTALSSDPPQNVLEARAWLDALNKSISPAASPTPSSQAANTVFAAPSSNGIPDFRLLGDSHIPNLSAAKIASDVFDNARVPWSVPTAFGTGTPAAATFTDLLISAMLEITSFQNISTVGGTFTGGIFLGIITGGLGNYNIPLANTLPGKLLLLKNLSGGTRTVARQGSDVIYNDGGTSSVTSFSMGITTWRLMISDGVSSWYAIG